MLQQLASYLPERDLANSGLACAALLAALLLGVWGALLFDGAGLGLNLGLWSATLLAAVVAVGRFGSIRLDPRRLALLSMSVALAATVAWRASAWLHWADLSAAATLVGVAMALPPGTGLRRMGFAVFLLAATTGAGAVVVGPIRLLPRDPAQLPAFRRLQEHAPWIGRAVMIAAPLVFVFAGLFIAADAVFEHLAAGLLHIDVKAIGSRLAWFLGCGWLALGVMWAAIALEPANAPSIELPDERRLRPAEVAIILGALVLLFAAFVLVQVRYLFGGHTLVERVAGLTYAQYARRGFFELVAAAALLLPVLLAVDWARRRDQGSRMFVALAASLVALLTVVIASAVQRLNVYQEAYGLSELRLYALAFLSLVGATFAWFAGTVLRGRSQAFLAGSLALALTAVMVLDAGNPDGLIAAVNIDRASEGKRFDAPYLTALGADAVPAIVARFDRVPEDERCFVATRLLERWAGSSSEWRAWSLSESRARSAVHDHRDELDHACGSLRIRP